MAAPENMARLPLQYGKHSKILTFKFICLWYCNAHCEKYLAMLTILLHILLGPPVVRIILEARLHTLDLTNLFV